MLFKSKIDWWFYLILGVLPVMLLATLLPDIMAGPFKWVVPLDEIESVTPSSSLVSSAALSIDRLELTYSKGKRILVSPEDKAGFLDAIGH